MANSKLCFVTNKVKGLQSSKKRLKLIEYLKNKLESNGVLFLQETHPISNDENAWADDFKGQVFFSHGTSNSGGVLTAYLGSKSFVVKYKRNDDTGHILMLDASIDDTDYILVNIYNANTETEQIKVLNNLHLLLDSLDIHQNKQIILAGDFNLFLDTTLEAEGGSPCLKKKSVAKLIKIK